jgi:Flp pilus assembly protein TadD
VAIRPNYPALSNMATLLRSEGRLEEAARTYEDSLAVSDRDYRVWGNLGATYGLLPGREHDAERCFRVAVTLAERQREVNPSDPKLLATLAQYLGELGQKVAMRQHIERALELAGERADLHFVAASVYAVLEDEKDQERARLELIHALDLGTPAASVEGEPVLAELLKDSRIQAALARRRAKEIEDEDAAEHGPAP